ncbi:putative late blight resistance protein homolog R1A-3 [Silene latifolia]|uniref:putative late blight resistance protein homolog R1A-3 n=1 Tax=Silene latifolia TaxID=37657 RepID=UPI003D77F122
MDLRSLCFKKLKSNELDFRTICLDFLKGITANMAQPNELLLVLIQSLVQMPDAKFLLLQLRESIVATEKDKLFANLMYSRGRSLVNLIESDTTSNIIRDVDLGGTEATQMYILFFSDLNDGVSSSLLEPVEGFKASVGQAYAEYIKLPHMELPKSELEFLDMILTLAELKESDAYLSVCIAPQIGVLHDYSLVCSSFLQRYAIRHNESEEVKGLWSRIMNFCRQMNNILDNFEEFPDWFLKVRLFSVIEEVKLITEEIYANDTVKIGVKRSNDSTQSQREKFQAVEHSDDDLQSKNEDEKLSFEDEDNLTTQLTTGSKNLEKIAIVGMAGLGKTTLAMNLYKRCAKSFYAQAWCYVGQEFQRKELLRDIIIQILEQPSSKIKDMGVEDLAKELKQSLIKKKNYLIVLDDVWDIDAWNALQKSFSSSNNGSRILITSRLKTVGEKVCDNKNVIELNFFSKEKSWYLLEKKVFGAKKCPQNLRDVGKGIAEKCEGLPLSIVVIAGALKNNEKTEESWKEVKLSLDSYLVAGGLGTLELSYRNLSSRMKQCFLYCSTFLKGKEIPRSKLVRLWVAERFIEEVDQGESLESAAYNYLLALVDRSLLMVAKTGSDNRIQTCRIHDLLRDFCVQKANEEKLMITIDGWNDPPIIQQRSRLCYFSGYELWNIKCHEQSKLDKARTLTFLTSYWADDSEHSNFLLFVFEYFESLIVLDLENVEGGSEIPASVAGLKLLRYLAIKDGITSIPSSIGEFSNLETLIVIGTRGEIDVPDSIFNLSKLRHLLVNKRAQVNIEYSNPNSLTNLENFSTPVLSGSSAYQIIVRMPNLRKLRCILMDKSFNVSILNHLSYLESLRALYHGGGRFQGKLSFPSNLYKLTLFKFRLPWSETEKIAALLPQLKILKLLFKAFEGEQWSTSSTFNNLKYLRMEELDIKTWEASDDKFPRLERLVVRRCKLLHTIPEDFASIVYLTGIEAHWCDVSVVKSVFKIKREQINGGNMKFGIIINPTVPDLNEEDDDEFSD